MKSLLLLLIVLVLIAPASGLAASSATLSGRITDGNGSPIAGAEVVLTNLATNAEIRTTTGDDGFYVIAEVAPATYRVTVAKQGFQQAVREPIQLNVGSKITLNLALAVGNISETVIVEASDAELVERDSAAVGTLVDRKFVENLPLNGRSFQSLIELAPGVVVAPSSITNPGQFSVSGQRTNANYFMVDGVSANIGASFTAQSFQQSAGTLPGLTVLGGTNSLASVDAVQEFRVQTSSYAPEFGRQPGGQISLVTRSGGNDLTFTLFEYFRNEKLDANDWFNNNTFNPQTGTIGIPRLPLRQNQFGGVVGGPVILPNVGDGGRKFYDGRDRTFFFFSYEGSRLRQPQPGERSFRVPSRAIRQSAIPSSTLAVLNAFPLPNAPALPGDPANTERYVTLYSFPSRFDAYGVRIDHAINKDVTIFGRYSNTPSDFTQRAFANGQNAFRLNTMTVTVGSNWTITPNVVNDLRVNFSTSRGVFEFEALPIDGAVLPAEDLIFPPRYPRESASASLQLFVSSNPTSISQGKTLGNKQRQWNIVENLTWVAGKHQLKFGGDIRRLSPIVDFRSIGISYNFEAPSQGSIPASQRTFRTDGLVNVNIQAFAPVEDFLVQNFSFYAQDTWRVDRKLTLVYGLRYEVNPPLSGDLLPYTLDGLENPLTATLAPPNTKQWETRFDNFAPRFGVAYSVRDGLVLRGGFGKYYDTGLDTALRGYTSYPYNSTKSLTNVPFPVDPQLLEPAPFNTNPPYSATFYVFDRNLKLPYTWQFNASLEKSFGKDQTVTVSYVGARANRLLRNEILRNQPARTIGTVTVPPIIVLNPALFTNSSTVFVTRNAAESQYDSGQLQFQRRLSRGLQVLASYTFSKSLDDASDSATGNLPESGSIGVINYDLANERGYSDFDVRHNFITAVSYDLPALKSGRFLRAVWNGWGIDTIVRARSGLPFSVFTQAVDPLIFASSTRRADIVPGVPVWLDDPASPGGRRLNRAAFSEPAVGTQGNSPRNEYRTTSLFQTDLAIRRTFPLTEKLRLQFRGEAFNVFNTPNFGFPNSNISGSAATFGRPTQMLNRSLRINNADVGFNPLYQIGGPRSLQFAVKLLF